MGPPGWGRLPRRSCSGISQLITPLTRSFCQGAGRRPSLFAVFLAETSELGASHRPASPQLLEGSVVTIIIAAQGSREALRSSASEPSPLYWGGHPAGTQADPGQGAPVLSQQRAEPHVAEPVPAGLGEGPLPPYKSTGTFWGPLLRGGSRPSEQRTRVGSQVALSAVGCVTTLSSPLPWTE